MDSTILMTSFKVRFAVGVEDTDEILNIVSQAIENAEQWVSSEKVSNLYNKVPVRYSHHVGVSKDRSTRA